MALHSLSSVVNRSLLAAATAALITGPLAAAGAAQTVEDLTDSTGKTLELTCKEALATEDEQLIEEFCEPEEIASPLAKSVDEVTTTVEKTAGDADGGTVAPDDGDGEGSTPKTPKETDEVLNTGGKAGGEKTKVKNTGGDFTPVSESTSGTASDGTRKQGSGAPTTDVRQSPGFDANGPYLPGMRSYSELTLQPFAAPLVSVPPVYELPQIASQLFSGSAATTGAADPQAAASASSFQAGSTTATPADASGWLAATATGLIMLVGAAHALNGGRTPSRKRA